MNPERWQRIKDAAAATFELEGDAREHFLDKECGTDQEFRRAVEEFLEGDEQPGDTVERAIAGAALQLTQESGSRHPYPAPGQTISHYKILSELGRGGMGVVYKAEDSKLERTVALKFLASHLLEDKEGRARFMREAKAAAALDHSNICTVHEIDEVEGQTFIAMACIEGQTVKDKIAERPLKLEEALDIAIQTAQGLQAAHEKGIVHRDIKGANLMVTPQGQVKVMDFGLAQLAEQSRLTKTATILGTPAYMSPEQAQKSTTDRRTDIWSLGVVIYEMVTGRLPFERERQEAVLYAIANEDPEPITAQRAGLPMELEWVVGKAMAKDASERYQHVEEMLVDLKSLSKRLAAGKSTSGVQPALTPQRPTVPVSLREEMVPKRKLRLHQALFAVTAVALLIPAVVHFRETPPEKPLRRFGLMPPVPVGNIGFFAHVSISPNGKHIAFVESRAEGRLWVQDLDKNQARSVEGTEGAFAPFWSPNSEFIGFAAKGELKTVSVQGGLSKRVCRMPTRICDGASWSPNGEMIVFTSGTPGVLFEVASGGGTPKLLITMEDLEASLGEPVRYIARPHFLPLEAGPRALVFTVSTTTRPNLLMVQDLETGRRELLGPGDYPFYSQSGHLLYQPTLTTSELWALHFSLDTLLGTGDPFLIAENGHGPTIAADGTLVYSTVAGSGPQRLVWVDRQSQQKTAIARTPEGASYPALSPDGQFVAVTQGEGQNVSSFGGDIWVYDIARGVGSRLSTSPKQDGAPIWSPSGQQVAHTSLGSGYPDIVLQSIGGSNKEAVEVLEDSPDFKSVLDWSRDGEYLIYQRADLKTGFDLYYLQRSEDDSGWEQHPFLQTPFNETGAKFSPDGEYVAHVSNESGQNEVYVRSFPGGSRRVRVSANGGTQVRWSRDGEELFYVEEETLVATSVSSGPTFEVGSTTRLFEHPRMIRGIRVWNPTYDVSADGQFFVVVEDIDTTEERSPLIHVVQNWYEEFRDREQD